MGRIFNNIENSTKNDKSKIEDSINKYAANKMIVVSQNKNVDRWQVSSSNSWIDSARKNIDGMKLAAILIKNSRNVFLK